MATELTQMVPDHVRDFLEHEFERMETELSAVS